VYRKLRFGRIGGAARRRAHERQYVRSAEPDGRQFGTYAGIEEAFAEAGRAELDKMIDEAGLPPWMIKKWEPDELA